MTSSGRNVAQHAIRGIEPLLNCTHPLLQVGKEASARTCKPGVGMLLMAEHPPVHAGDCGKGFQLPRMIPTCVASIARKPLRKAKSGNA